MPYDAILIGVNQHALLMNLDYIVFQDREIYPVLKDADAPLCTHHRDLAHIHTGIIPDYGLSGATACFMADYLEADQVILAGMDNYSGGRRYWHSPPNFHGAESGISSMDVWHLCRRHLQRPERVKAVSGPLAQLFGSVQ